MSTLSQPPRLSKRRALMCFIVCGLLFYLPQHLHIPAEVTAWSFLMDTVAAAVDCAQDRGCDLKIRTGAPHGGGFVHHLALVFSLGGSVRDAWRVAAVLTSLAFGLLALVVARTFGEAVAYSLLPVSHLAAGVGIHLGGPLGAETFWNPTLIPLASLLFCAARRRIRGLCVRKGD